MGETARHGEQEAETAHPDAAAPFRIFLNYRREDSAGHVRRLWDALRSGIEGQPGFRDDQIFIDIDMIQPGVREAIRKAVEASDVFLAVIGKQWLTVVDSKGQRRLDDPADFVRIEIEAALERAAEHHDVRVVPTRVQGADMPGSEDLPDALADLAHRNGVDLTDERWHYDVGRLLTSLKKLERDKLERTSAAREAAERPAAEYRPPSPTSPEGPPPPIPAEGPLTIRLRQAALAGVVPESVASRATPDIESWDARADARRESPYPALVRIALPLALLGALAAALKWLFGVFLTPIEGTEGADTVECTVFAPPAAAPGSSILVQAFVHLPEEADSARAIALELDTDARRRAFRSLHSPVTRGSRLHFELRMPGLEVDDPLASIVWRGRTEAVQFGVRVPARAPAGTVIGTLEISLDSAPLGHVKFKLAIERRAVEASSEPQGEQARRYSAAFISYASRDRDEVLRRVQMLASVGIKYFQDVLTLEPGDRWSKKIELGIDECDLFLLFWSSEAKRSEWVRREVEYALSRKAGNDLSPPEIRPVIVEGPPIIEPWEELADLHFNDRLLYFMRPTNAR